MAEEVTGAEEAWVAEAGAAEAGVAEAGAAEAGVAEALSVEAGVADGLSMATVTGVVARTVISGPTAGVVFPTAATDTARQS